MVGSWWRDRDGERGRCSNWSFVFVLRVVVRCSCSLAGFVDLSFTRYGCVCVHQRSSHPSAFPLFVGSGRVGGMRKVFSVSWGHSAFDTSVMTETGIICHKRTHPYLLGVSIIGYAKTLMWRFGNREPRHPYYGTVLIVIHAKQNRIAKWCQQPEHQSNDEQVRLLWLAASKAKSQTASKGFLRSTPIILLQLLDYDLTLSAHLRGPTVLKGQSTFL